MNPAPTISNISFAGLRRLNSFDYQTDDLLAARGDWEKSRTVYEMKQVNVFVGRNGGGKSTVLDLVDQLRNPDRICNLPRENRNRFSHCFWELTISTGARVLGMAAPSEWSGVENDSNLIGPLDTQALHIELVELCLPASGPQRFLKNVSKRELSPESRSELLALFKQLSINVVYWSSDEAITPVQIEAALNQIAPLLSGLISDPTSPQSDFAWPGQLEVGERLPVQALECGRYALYLSDEVQVACRVTSSSLLDSRMERSIELSHFSTTASKSPSFIASKPRAAAMSRSSSRALNSTLCCST